MNPPAQNSNRRVISSLVAPQQGATKEKQNNVLEATRKETITVKDKSGTTEKDENEYVVETEEKVTITEKTNTLSKKSNDKNDNKEKINNKDNIKEKTEKDYKIKINRFEDLKLREELLRGIFAHGFETPSAIQQNGIMPIIDKRDVIAQAQSGTGKTAMFLIGALQQIDEKLDTPQVVIVSPTRLLAIQTHKVAEELSQFMKVEIALLIGGKEVRNDIKKLQRRCHIVIGTPGRIEHMTRRSRNGREPPLDIRDIKILIIDEADEMLSQGFKEQIRDIIGMLPISVQTCLVSATMSHEILDMTRKFMNNPIKILVKREEVTLEGIRQYFVNVRDSSYKFEVLLDLYNVLCVAQTIIYVNTIQCAVHLQEDLEKKDFTASVIHSKMDQDERERVMTSFRDGQVRILIATDIIARGIDVQQVALVVNYDVPNEKETYIHRIGRSGRFGRKGVAINLIASRDREDIVRIREIEKFYDTQIREMPNLEELRKSLMS
jgi:superfamily II DNA/RNA helicase